MKEHHDEFWRDVLSRVETAQPGAFERVSLEEAERRMAAAEEELPLGAAAVDRMVAEATRPRGLDAGRPGGRVLGFPAWSRRAVAAGLVLAPLVAVAFWQAYKAEDAPDFKIQERLAGELDFPLAIDVMLDPDVARMRAAATGFLEDIEEQARRERTRAQGRVGAYLMAGVVTLKQVKAPGELGRVAEAGLADLEARLLAPQPVRQFEGRPIESAIKELNDPKTPTARKLDLCKLLVRQLALGIAAMQASIEEGGQLETTGHRELQVLSSALQN